MKFDPDKPHSKVRGMTGIHYEQDGHKFSASHRHLGKLKTHGVVEPETSKDDIRARARAKIAAKKGDLEGFKPKEKPGTIDALLKENQAAKQAEDLAE